MSISWSDWVEPKKGSYNNSALSSFDRGIDLARAAGVKVLIMVEESPSWARDSDNKNSPPRNNADLADFVRFLATRYRGKVEGYEIWNEPNLKWAWPSGPNPAQYARMLKAVSPAVKLGDPAAKVVFAGTFTSDYRFLEGAELHGGRHRLQHARVLRGVRAARPRPLQVRLVPDLIALDLAPGSGSRGSGRSPQGRRCCGAGSSCCRSREPSSGSPSSTMISTFTPAARARSMPRSKLRERAVVVRPLLRLDPIRPADAHPGPLGVGVGERRGRLVLNRAAHAPGQVRHDAGLGGTGTGGRRRAPASRPDRAMTKSRRHGPRA